MRGTESEVAGMISATSNMKTVSESNTVIPAEKKEKVIIYHPAKGRNLLFIHLIAEFSRLSVYSLVEADFQRTINGLFMQSRL